MDLNNKKNRRTFLKSGITGAAMLAIGTKSLAKSLSIFENKNEHSLQTLPSMNFTQMPLPYNYDALEDVIDATTMEIHYSKHAANYCKNLNEAVIAEKIDNTQSLESILSTISKYSVKLRNNAGGHYNHEMFWKCMRPKNTDNKPSDSVLKKIEAKFVSFQNFKNQFTDAAKTRFGSGWAWLYINNNGELQIGSTANQDNPLMDIATIEVNGFPLLCIDVWEHAYYLKYQNKRADYIENWWNVVNWNYVEERILSHKH